MISLKKRNLGNRGFTIVELLIVIVVIGILALLVITTYSGIQAKARNAKRQTDIQAIQTQLEAFFSENGYYPSFADLDNQTSPTWVKDNLKSLDPNALIDPSSSSSSETLVNGTGGADKTYQYAPTASDGTSCEDKDTTCAKYTLTAKYEGTVNGQTTYVKSNLD
ncbi:MAG TPA: prepilin-type N-terminal cleavage/methylation domain-containing protein [Candidatus Saccharimonadales bacterium]|nr:prepilin-type N-terminal cleavage/methylation domain-containing protein [Candidatus Saccharimonadales bacterium]